MDFLTNAIFSDETGLLLGAMITHFAPEEYTSRASVKLYTLDELRASYATMSPRGFRLQEEGVLTADTSVRKVLSNSVMSFVESECSRLGAREVDITDLVLHGVQYGGATVTNPSDVLESVVQPRLLPFQNYRVSSSSFNIYGAYQQEDGTFRTHSLLELEDGGDKEFYCVFPEDVDMTWSASICQAVKDVTVGDTSMTLYKVHSCLKPFYTCVGEAFLNYLAYNVAYYNVGRKFLKEVSPAIKEATAPEDRSPVQQEKRYPRKNVAIEHTYDKLCLAGISKCSGDNNRLIEYLQEVPEATVTMHWLNKLFESPWYRETPGTEEDKARTACANLMIECKENGLKYGLELLTHRYYLSVINRYEDFVPLVLKGGGVSGESLKRLTVK